MSAHDGSQRFEYPDSAGYPDGAGFLDEGTAALLNDSAGGDVDRPSADSDSEVEVRRDDGSRVYAATLAGRELANLRYDEVDGRVVILTTTVVPEFRGRGFASQLIAYALDDIRDRGKRITVYCPLVSAFLSENRQFADLIDPEYPGR